MNSLLRLLVGAGAVACLLLGCIPWVQATRATVHPDFDLYYYGGRVQRAGTLYTDSRAVLTLEARDGARPTPDAVVGAPALVTLVFEPLSLLKLHVAQRVWLLACLALVIVSLRRASRRWWPVWFLLLSILPGIRFGLELGQPSFVTFSLLAMAYADIRDGTDRRAGLLIGLATVLKVYPAFVLVALLAGRRWIALKWALLTGLVLTVVSLPLLGSGIVPAYREVISSAGGSLVRNRTESLPSFIGAVAHDLALANLLSPIMLVAAAALILRMTRQPTHAVFAVAAMAMLLAERITWEHYLPLALVGLFCLADLRVDRKVAAMGAVGYLLLLLPARADQMLYPRTIQTLDSGVHIYGVILILLTVLWALDLRTTNEAGVALTSRSASTNEVGDHAHNQ